MAQKVITTLVDDLDGTSIEDGKGETVAFALDGTSYEIDLTDTNAKRLRDSLSDFVNAGRVTTSGRAGQRRSPSPAGRTRREELAAAREWLRANGHQISDRGRIPANLFEEYRSNR